MAVALNPNDVNPYVAEIVELFQHYMHSECGLRASEIVKGGSLGQGTAVPGEFDLDLVVYSVDIRRDDMLDSAVLKGYLKKIDQLLSQHLKKRYTSRQFNNHGIQFKLSIDSGKKLSVDLLPSPYFMSVNEFHSFLAEVYARKPSDLRMFSCSAAKWLKEFFKRQPNEVKDFIKKAKSWRNNKWPVKYNNDGRPKSILISLLVIEAYHRSVTLGQSGRAQSVTELMKEDIRDHKNLSVQFEGALYQHHKQYRHYFPRGPYIIDPSNPFNNVYLSGVGYYKANSPEGTFHPGDGKWTKLVEYVDTLDLANEDGTKKSWWWWW